MVDRQDVVYWMRRQEPNYRRPFFFFSHHIRIENMKQYKTTLNKSDKWKTEGKEMN
jgi:hypothetical protein